MNDITAFTLLRINNRIICCYCGWCFVPRIIGGFHITCSARTRINIDVCGIATGYRVRATALDGVREGFDTSVLLDLTAAVAPGRVAEVSAELAAVGVAIRA